MKGVIRVLCGMLLGVSLSSFAINEIEDISPQDAFEKGSTLRLQYHNEQALHYLKYAADEGHSMAALLYADELATLPHAARREDEIVEYTFKSADSGNVWAMQRLAKTNRSGDEEQRIQWQTHFLTALEKAAEEGNSKAMLALFYRDREDNYKQAKFWLRKALEQGYLPAQYAKIELVEHGYEEWFVLPGNRLKTVKKQYVELAETGYLPAIKKTIQLMIDTDKTHEAVVWMEKAVDQGDATSLALLAKAYAGNFTKTRVETNLVKSYSYYQNYLDAIGSDRLIGTRKRIEKEELAVKEKLTEEQLAAADLLHQEYRASHTVKQFEMPWKYEME
ncbi:tetratricopeptide repeat protein [Vibrio penaeicida]|uniref:Sel1 repeat family protein n=1 Tax=Vibrio penaeicida TaxID=104609 RepID=A0AAV5NUM3_9VIBR|nr:sel1 repeat family protein [Vibrio penaeicida]RTZ23362.1 sel1 repeat family protein [Vibrio penaeicida]GLQ74305.1 hypothetical protein GCM10007932_36660 [Vibrio penaeicida]